MPTRTRTRAHARDLAKNRLVERLHGLGVLHNDVKPLNFVVGRGDNSQVRTLWPTKLRPIAASYNHPPLLSRGGRPRALYAT